MASLISPSDKHGVEHDSQSPHIRGPSGIPGVGSKDLWADVGRAPVLVLEEVVTGIVQDEGVLQRFQFEVTPGSKKECLAITNVDLI